MVRILSVVAVLIAVLLGPAEVMAKVTVEAKPQPYEIRAAGYHATVASDGCLTNFRVAGQEFLAPGVSLSRGSYYYRNGAVKLPRVSLEGEQVIAESDVAAIEYESREDGMRWHLTNRSAEQLIFFLVLAEEVEAVAGPDDQIVKPAVATNWQRVACYRGGSKLEIEGCDLLWGPWQGSHQVVQVTLKPDEKRELKLVTGKTSEADKADILALAKPVKEEAVVVHSPLNYQVFQRRTQHEGPLLISGRFRNDCQRAEYRISGKPPREKMVDAWAKLPLIGNGQFNLPLSLPAGGWYQLQLRSYDSDQVNSERTIEKFGVGEVFVGAGQSNSTNSGQFKTQQTTGMVSSFGGDTWQLANDPQPGVADRSQGGSFWPAFGDALYEKFGVPIGVATTGYGGTSVNAWQPEGNLFEWTSTRINQLGPLGFRALLWHQGESDVNMPADEYYQKLRNTIVSSRNHARWEIPWFVAQATYHNAEKPSFADIREAQARLWKDGVALAGPDTDQLRGDHRDLDGKGIHFSPKGLKVHGQMWAKLAGEFIQAELAKAKE